MSSVRDYELGLCIIGTMEAGKERPENADQPIGGSELGREKASSTQ